MGGITRGPWGPIHSSSRPATAITPSSSRIWNRPGCATLSRDFMSRQTTVTTATITIVITRYGGMTSCPSTWKPSAPSSAAAGGPSTALTASTIQSGCSCMTCLRRLLLLFEESRGLDSGCRHDRRCACHQPQWGQAHLRSEEHTSELQSHSELVCRLLLAKKKLARETRSRLSHV